MAKLPAKSPNRRVQPRKAIHELKSDLIQIRVTAEQHRALKETADRAGLDLSSWLRMVGLKATNEENR